MPTDFEVVRELVTRTGGVITRRAGNAAGISDATLRKLVISGSLVRLTRGVYCVGKAQLTDPRVIARRHRVVISYESAATILGGDMPRPPDKTHATAPRCRGQRRNAYPGVRLHRSNLGGDDVVRVNGIPVTSPLRTALDISRTSALEHAVAIVDSLLRKGLLSLAEFIRAAERMAGPGRARVQLVVSLLDPGSGSVLESLTRVLLWRRRLTPPQSQFWVRHRPSDWRGRVDFAWPELLVIVECDGYEWHSERHLFQNDRRRWTTLARAGWLVAVVTWFDVTRDADYVVSAVRDLIAVRVRRLHQHTNVTHASPGTAS